MCKGIIGKKLGMTGVFAPDGRHVPVTVIQAGPCVITQIKMQATDGYNALQLGFEEKSGKRTTKPQQGHFKRSGEKCFHILKEVEVDKPDEFEVGQIISTDLFSIGETVDITGITKGRGFAGVIKRHGFAGGSKTHGSRSHRIPGSIGCSAWPAKVIKGKKLPGHYGNDLTTTRNLEVIDIRPDQNLILLKGAVPGAKSGIVKIKKVKFKNN